MPTYAFNTLNDLVAYLQTEIAPNGTQAITGAKHQDVVVTIALSLVNIVSSIPPTTLNQFPPYEAGTVYNGGVEVVVRHTNKLWLFVSASNQIGVTPGTNGLVWQELSAAQLAHFRNLDQMLDQGGPHQVTAAEIHALLNSPPPLTNTTWKRSFDELDVTPPGSPVADVTYLVDVGATGAWAGHELSLASWVSGAWEFEQLVDGDALRYSQGGYLAFITGGTIALYDLDLISAGGPVNLEQVLSTGRNSGANRPVLERGFHLTATLDYHSSPGLFTIDPTLRSAWNIGVSADIELNAPNGSATGLYFVKLRHTGGFTHGIAFAPNITLPPGVSVPSVLNPTEGYVLMCICSDTGTEGGAGANLTVIGAYKVN